MIYDTASLVARRGIEHNSQPIGFQYFTWLKIGYAPNYQPFFDADYLQILRYKDTNSLSFSDF